MYFIHYTYPYLMDFAYEIHLTLFFCSFPHSGIYISIDCFGLHANASSALIYCWLTKSMLLDNLLFCRVLRFFSMFILWYYSWNQKKMKRWELIRWGGGWTDYRRWSDHLVNEMGNFHWKHVRKKKRFSIQKNSNKLRNYCAVRELLAGETLWFFCNT